MPFGASPMTRPAVIRCCRSVLGRWVRASQTPDARSREQASLEQDALDGRRIPGVPGHMAPVLAGAVIGL
jgi:hypothetical protein